MSNEIFRDEFTVRSLRLVSGTISPIESDDLTSIIRPFLIRNEITVKAAINYCERVLADYRELKPHLPPAHGILEVGAAWGAHALYLAKHYGLGDYHLIEGTETISKPHTGFREDTQPYRDGTIGQRLLRASGIHGRLHPVGEETYAATFQSVDLIVSFCAYLHHFPAHTYLPLIQRALPSGGHLLADVRTGTNGREQMKIAGFEVRQIIREKPKYTRILFKKK